MGVDMLEKNSFYTFGRKVSSNDPNGEFKNFLPIFAAGAIVLGRKRKADKTRQEIADKYQNLRVDCDGIDSSIKRVSDDLSALKSAKPRKNKDERVWKIRVEETENTLTEIQSAKRNLICTKPEKPVPPVEVKDNIPSPNPSGSGTSGQSPNYPTGALLDSPTASGVSDSESPVSSGAKKNYILYIVLGLAAVGGIIYFMRKK